MLCWDFPWHSYASHCDDMGGLDMQGGQQYMMGYPHGIEGWVNANAANPHESVHHQEPYSAPPHGETCYRAGKCDGIIVSRVALYVLW